MGTSNTLDPPAPAADPRPGAETAANPPEKIEASASAPQQVAAAATADLPQVDAPTLDTSEPIGVKAAPESGATPGAPTSAGFSRFALLAASIAVAAAIGSFAGALATTGIAWLMPSGATAPVMAAEAAQGVKQSAVRSAEYAALKANLDSLSRSANAQFTKLAERLDRAERAQAEPMAKIARIAEALDRLEKQGTAPVETTGSIAGAGTPKAANGKPEEKVLDGWVLHEVKRGRALLESRYGGLFEVRAGGFLPGVGRVQEIKREDGRWVVVTTRGVIAAYY
jgi:hypothetical protein